MPFMPGHFACIQDMMLQTGKIEVWLLDPYRRVSSMVRVGLTEDRSSGGPRKVQATKAEIDTWLGLEELSRVCRVPIQRKYNTVYASSNPGKCITIVTPDFDNVSTKHPVMTIDVNGLKVSVLGRALLYKTLVEDDNSAGDFSMELSDFPGISVQYKSKRTGNFDSFACVACGQPARRKCSQCKMARYCGMECHVADWKQHKVSCRFFAMTRPT